MDRSPYAHPRCAPIRATRSSSRSFCDRWSPFLGNPCCAKNDFLAFSHALYGCRARSPNGYAASMALSVSSRDIPAFSHAISVSSMTVCATSPHVLTIPPPSSHPAPAILCRRRLESSTISAHLSDVSSSPVPRTRQAPRAAQRSRAAAGQGPQSPHRARPRSVLATAAAFPDRRGASGCSASGRRRHSSEFLRALRAGRGLMARVLRVACHRQLLARRDALRGTAARPAAAIGPHGALVLSLAQLLDDHRAGLVCAAVPATLPPPISTASPTSATNRTTCRSSRYATPFSASSVTFMQLSRSIRVALARPFFVRFGCSVMATTTGQSSTHQPAMKAECAAVRL